MKHQHIQINYIASEFIVNANSGNHLHSKGFATFSKQLFENEGGFVLTPLEVLYIYENKQNVTLHNFTITSPERFLKKHHISHNEYRVFCDLIRKGYIVKQALKFGAHFRIYDKSSQDEHATHLVFIIEQKRKIDPQELFANMRIAHSTRKKILLAFVDYELSINYIEQSRWK
ncbi:MAG: tRNA-intron lyase [Candidatus Nanoarchaeia archaeon]